MNRALLLDAAGTLLYPVEPVADTYLRFARERALPVTRVDFRSALRRPRGLHQIGDGRPFWRAVVAEATGCDDAEYFEALYLHYGRAAAWRLADDALPCLDAIRTSARIAIVSNWDTRLRGLLGELRVLEHVDTAVISGEVGVEKPDPAIFHEACARLGVSPASALHVGDDLRADVRGARAAGCAALHWGQDVASFQALAGHFA